VGNWAQLNAARRPRVDAFGSITLERDLQTREVAQYSPDGNVRSSDTGALVARFEGDPKQGATGVLVFVLSPEEQTRPVPSVSSPASPVAADHASEESLVEGSSARQR
jgi:hypothetical protein